MIEVEGHAFRLIDGEPRVRDLDLAAWLGFEHPREIRRLIERHVESGLLDEKEAFRVTVTRNPGQRGRLPDSERWLNHTGAVKIAAKSEGPRANAILCEVVRVWDAVRRHVAAVPAALPARPIAATEDELRTIDDAIGYLDICCTLYAVRKPSDGRELMRRLAVVRDQLASGSQLALPAVAPDLHRQPEPESYAVIERRSEHVDHVTRLTVLDVEVEQVHVMLTEAVRHARAAVAIAHTEDRPALRRLGVALATLRERTGFLFSGVYSGFRY